MNTLKFFRKPYLSLFIASFILFTSCAQKDTLNINNQEIETNKKDDKIIESKLKSNLKKDNSYIELISIQESITKKVKQNKVSIPELKNAYLSNNIGKIKSLIGFNDEELNLMDQRIKQLGYDLKSKYPELLIDSSVANCLGCNIDKEKISYFFDNFEILTNYNSTKSSLDDGCADYTSFTICLIVCTTSGPVIYWLCSYLCYRTYCVPNET
ncbi:MAG: hypothetical protein KKG99_13175 [Bacteroidetes bacterium]|nr:hypothetical protein [Bacteroidota bacterium]